MKRGVGKLETTIARSAALIVEQGVSIPTCHRRQESQLVWRITVTQSKTPVRSRRQDDRRRANHTHRVSALPQSHPGLCGTLVGPGKDTHGSPVPLRREAVGGPRHASRDTSETTRPRLTAPRTVKESFEEQQPQADTTLVCVCAQGKLKR